MPSRPLLIRAACACLVAHSAAAQSVITQAEALSVDVSTERGEIVFDLLGDLWTVRIRGGVASPLAETPFPAARPRWSPDASRLVFESREPAGGGIYLVDIEDGEPQRLTPDGAFDRQPVWHPEGTRIAFSGRRDGADFDIWETDLATGLAWRLAATAGDDGEPAWSADGRNLAWIRRNGERWFLMLRRFGQPPEVLVDSAEELRAPSWRPDGTLLTYFRDNGRDFDLQMIILSEPPLERTLVREPGLFPAPVAWLDRHRLFYSADDQIKTRDFDDWKGRTVRFRASLATPKARQAFVAAERELPVITPGKGPLVIRAGRIFDGYAASYREGTDVLIENGVIADVTAARDWGGTPIIELAATTMLPGLIDLHAELPAGEDGRVDDASGAEFLSWGVTTIVARPPDGFDPARWDSEATPGPQVLPAVGLDERPPGSNPVPASLPFVVIDNGDAQATGDAATAVSAWQQHGVPVLAAGWRRAAQLRPALVPIGDQVTPADTGDLRTRRRSFGRLTFDLTTHQLVSALADSRTSQLDKLYGARQAAGSVKRAHSRSRAALADDLRRVRAPVAVASAANGFSPGLATLAELLALDDARLPPDQILKAAGRQAAAMIGLGGSLGEISVGARADLVLVAGDPLSNVADLRNVVAVVRNGRFLSLANLLERRETVE